MSFKKLFLLKVAISLIASVAFTGWQISKNPDGIIIHFFFGCALFISLTIIIGFLEILEAIKKK